MNSEMRVPALISWDDRGHSVCWVSMRACVRASSWSQSRESICIYGRWSWTEVQMVALVAERVEVGDELIRGVDER